MKKLIFTSLIAVASLSTFAQGNSQKNKNHHSVSKKDKEHDDDRYEDRKGRTENIDRNDDRYDERDNRDRRENNRNDNRNNQNNNYSTNTPRKVADAFRNDYPNANNVRWTKDRGVWTANFGGGGLFGSTNTVSYKANGQRISGNGNIIRRN